MLPKVFLQLDGDIADLKKALDGGKSSAVFYATSSARCFVTAALDRFFLYITPDRVSARTAADLLSEMTGGEVVLIPEKEDLLINAHAFASGIVSERMRALTAIYTGKARGAVISAEGLAQYFPLVSAFEESVITLKKGEDLPPSFSDKLIAGGYRQEQMAESKGSFAIRGNIVDVWAASEELPVRIELFGDTIENIRLFTPESMMSIREIEEYMISPKSDILLSQKAKEGILKRLLSIKRTAAPRLAEIVSEMENKLHLNPSDPSLVWVTPFIKGELSSIFDYLPATAVVVFDEIKAADDKLKLFINAHNIRVKSFAEAGEATLLHIDSLISRDAIYDKVRERTILSFQQVTAANPIYEPSALFNIKCLPVTKYSANYSLFVTDIKTMLPNGTQVFIFAGSDSAAEGIKSFLNENGLASAIRHEGDGEDDIIIVPRRISKGFIYPKHRLALIGTDDIIRRAEPKKKSTQKKRQNFLMPVKGDFVVHDLHGIGLSEGVVTVDTLTGKRDFYIVLYRGGDKLYLPVDQMDSLEKYSGGGVPTLHKIGGREFERVKERVRQSVKKLAIDLVSLYEKRLNLKGHRYQPDTVWQKELEDSFEFVETDDQLIAAAEIKEDMEKGKVMDRLLCGDVGFGKTEVAIRAIFKTVIEGKQAAILSPTTILCQQHYNTVKTRLQSFGITIDVLSRFVPEREIKAALTRIKEGKTSVIVATHRLLSKDVVFNDLGLLVLDEEQRFGVEHKEKIKLLKNNINVLALSATPIPRTLHMALSGIRDISTLETPPQNRMPVETYVIEYSDALVKDAIGRELARGGQAFILYNRVKGIANFHAHISELLGGEVSVIYAHGQMESYELEEKIRAFYNKEADVLISTTIIENGIDLPDANTLIVVDSDRLGLSEMYQLRGRVGRSHNLAYAYFTVREGKVLTENAEKRLDALLNNTELGSGFRIAMQDLEIRGAGNVLGREQHGNMEKVGYDMYCRILTETVGELRGILPEPTRAVEIVADGDISLPPEYITNGERRVGVYKDVALLSSKSEMDGFLDGLKDIYGTPPQSVFCLAAVGLVKNLAAAAGVKKIVATADALGIHFYNGDMFKKEGLFRALNQFKNDAVLAPSDPPVIIFDNKGKNQRERLVLLIDFFLAASEQNAKG
ncbi:MAG: transcription-repair coupling factor [Clostridia bacterium]